MSINVNDNENNMHDSSIMKLTGSEKNQLIQEMRELCELEHVLYDKKDIMQHNVNTLITNENNNPEHVRALITMLHNVNMTDIIPLRFLMVRMLTDDSLAADMNNDDCIHRNLIKWYIRQASMNNVNIRLTDDVIDENTHSNGFIPTVDDFTNMIITCNQLEQKLRKWSWSDIHGVLICEHYGYDSKDYLIENRGMLMGSETLRYVDNADSMKSLSDYAHIMNDIELSSKFNNSSDKVLIARNLPVNAISRSVNMDYMNAINVINEFFKDERMFKGSDYVNTSINDNADTDASMKINSNDYYAKWLRIINSETGKYHHSTDAPVDYIHVSSMIKDPDVLRIMLRIMSMVIINHEHMKKNGINSSLEENRNYSSSESNVSKYADNVHYQTAIMNGYTVEYAEQAALAHLR